MNRLPVPNKPALLFDADAYLIWMRGVVGVELEPWQEKFIRQVFDARRPDDRLTTADIEREYGVRRATVWKWAERGLLQPIGQARGRGRPAALYRRNDVESAIGRGSPQTFVHVP